MVNRRIAFTESDLSGKSDGNARRTARAAGQETAAGPAQQVIRRERRPARMRSGPKGYLPTVIGRIPITGAQPVVECGRWPAKAVTGETFPVTATVFREGHGIIGAAVVLIGPDGRPRPPVPMALTAPGNDSW